MKNISNRPGFRHKRHLYFLRKLLIIANLLGLSTYIFLHIIFYDIPFVLQDELVIVAKIIGISTAIAVGLSFILFAVDALAYYYRNRKQIKFPTIVQVAEPGANIKSVA